MEAEGKVFQVMPVQEISTQKGQMRKLDFVLEIDSKFPRKICFSLWNDKLDLFTAKPGDNVKVSFDLSSKEFKGRWYTEANAWKIENLSLQSPKESENTIADINEEISSSFISQKEEIDDLPF